MVMGCSTNAVMIASTSCSPMRGALALAIAVGLRRQALAMPAGPPQRERVSSTAGAGSRADGVFEGGRDGGDQAADAVADPEASLARSSNLTSASSPT
jgi:hypothetical protein